VRNLHVPYHAALIAIVVFGAVTFGLTASVQPVLAAGPADGQTSDVYRLINGERAFLGKRALKVDTYLASKARDGAISCPNNSSLVMQGRAKDFATYGYPSNSHLLRLCTKYTALDAMKLWGYNTYRGEVTAVNGGFGTGAHEYTFGCSPTNRTCTGSTTTASYTAVRTVYNWVSSATHYAVIVGNYDRIGCGTWVGSNGAFFYDCLVSLGGRRVSKTASKPAAPKPTAAPTATPIPTPTPEPTGTPFVEVFRPSFEVTPTPEPSPSESVEALTGDTNYEAAPPPETSRDVSVAAGAAAASASLGYGLFLNFKRRRRRRRLKD
jgi:hypothetical protein